jgi:hypothetical protein
MARNLLPVVVLMSAIICVVANLPLIVGKSSAQTFGEIINLSGGLHGSHCAVVRVSGNNAYVTWESNAIGDGDIIFSRSTDGGATFSPPIDLSGQNPQGSTCPDMAVSGSNIYIVWAERVDSAEGAPVFFRSSFDGGSSFNPLKKLTTNDEDNETPNPLVAASGKKAYVTWTRDFPNPSKTMFRRTLDGGGTFGGIKNLVTDSKIDTNQARIAVSGDTVYVVWRGAKGALFEGADIYMRVSKNNGKDFGSTKNLSNNAGVSTDPVVRASGNNVYVAWIDETTGNQEIFFKRSTDQGSSFGSTKNLSNTSRDSSESVLSSAGTNTVYIVWSDGFPNGDIFFKRSTDSGNHFGSRINLSNDPNDSGGPVIARDGDNVNIAWEDNHNQFSNSQILFKRSTDKGISFGSTINLSDGFDDSFDPVIVSNDGNVFITWTEFTDGDFEIFFRETANQFGVTNSSHIIIPMPIQ